MIKKVNIHHIHLIGANLRKVKEYKIKKHWKLYVKEDNPDRLRLSFFVASQG